jgi:hypothetical protein
VWIWLRRIAGLGIALAAAGAVVSFAPAPRPVVAHMVAVPRPSPVPLPVTGDPAYAIAYQRGHEPGPRRHVLVERWVMAGRVVRERVTVDGRLFADRSAGRDVDYPRREWRTGSPHGLDSPCARPPGEVTAGLADGSITISGAGTRVAGVETIVVRQHGRSPMDLWVTPEGHRVVRCRAVAPEAVTFDVVWLPATDVSLAQLAAVVPDDFTMVTDRS